MMETPMHRGDDREKVGGTETLDMPPPPTTTQPSEHAAEASDIQLPPLSNFSDRRPNAKSSRAEVPDSDDLSESSGDEVHVHACGMPIADGTRNCGIENGTEITGIESSERDIEFEGMASGQPAEDIEQVQDSASLLSKITCAPKPLDQARSALSTEMPISITGARIFEPVDGQQLSHAAPTVMETPQAPAAPPTEISQTADEIVVGDDETPEDGRDTEMAKVTTAESEFQTASISPKAIPSEKRLSNNSDLADGQAFHIADAPVDAYNIGDSTASSTALQQSNNPENVSVLLGNTRQASEAGTKANNPSALPASPKAESTGPLEIIQMSPSIQDSADSSRLSSPGKAASPVSLDRIMKDIPDLCKFPPNILSSLPKPETSQGIISRYSTGTASFPAPEGSQSKDILMVELKAMKLASIQARNAALEAEIASKRARLEEVTKGLKHPAGETVRRHIKLLHDYNDIRDVGQGLVGMIADSRGVRIGELYEEFGVGLRD